MCMHQAPTESLEPPEGGLAPRQGAWFSGAVQKKKPLKARDLEGRSLEGGEVLDRPLRSPL